MIVVSDTSPLLSLALIGRLDLLRDLYGAIQIPAAVRAEILLSKHSGVQGNGAQAVAQAAWIVTHSLEPDVSLKLLLRELDQGEAEAIALALQLKAEVVLIDERKARQLAQYLELNVVGLLDVLQAAKARQLITHVKPVLDELMTRARFRVSHKLYQRTLTTSGE